MELDGDELLTIWKSQKQWITEKNVKFKEVDLIKCCETDDTMRLCHPPDGSTSHKYMLLCFKPP